MAIDPAGEVYIASTTARASPFPTTPGAFQSTPPYPNGSGVVAKLNASGSALLYATYLSGNGLSVPQGIAIDAAGDAFVAGYTQAADFPVTPGAFQTAYFPSAQYMEFVTKLNPQGTGLVYSTFLGATLNGVSEIKVDAQGGAYVLAQGGAELSSGGYLSHLSADGSALVYSTYVPTATGLGLDLDSAGSAFVVGACGERGSRGISGSVSIGISRKHRQRCDRGEIHLQWTVCRRYLRVRIADCRRWATDRGGSQRRDHAGGRGRQYDGHQHLPVADGAERGERHGEHRRARRDRHTPRLRAWSRGGRAWHRVRRQWTSWEALRSHSAELPLRCSPRSHNRSPCRCRGRSPAKRPLKSSSLTMVVRRPGRRHRYRWLSRRQRRGFTPSRIPTGR